MSTTTKKALANSLKKLLSKKTLDKITVKEITDNCGVNRQTFYYHFQDIYDLMEWIFEDELKALEEVNDDVDWKESVHLIFSSLLDNRAFIINAYNSISNRILRHYLIKTVKPRVSDTTERLATNIKILDEDKRFIVDIYTIVLVGLAMTWIDENMPVDYLEKLNKLTQLMDDSIRYALKKFAIPNN